MAKDRIAIACGGRSYRWEPGHRQIYTSTLEVFGITLVFHGDCGRRHRDGSIICGADLLAAESAEALGRRTRAFPAKWEAHGKAAGPLRNKEMLREVVHLVFALPGGRGTADMVRQAKAAGVPVVQLHMSRHWWCDA